MDMRAEVYSPLQNASVWLAAWLHGHEATDNLLDAFSELGVDCDVDKLSELRAAMNGIPTVRLVLSGPGEPSGLPNGLREAIIVGTKGLTASGLLIDIPSLPAPSWLSPGEADAILTRATNEAAELISKTGYRNDSLRSPRLTVGTLSDFYDTPGLPPSVPSRAAKLFARADNVAAIVETVTDKLNDHSLDHFLLSLWRHIRQARMAGVTYASIELARG